MQSYYINIYIYTHALYCNYNALDPLLHNLHTWLASTVSPGRTSLAEVPGAVLGLDGEVGLVGLAPGVSLEVFLARALQKLGSISGPRSLKVTRHIASRLGSKPPVVTVLSSLGTHFKLVLATVQRLLPVEKGSH